MNLKGQLKMFSTFLIQTEGDADAVEEKKDEEKVEENVTNGDHAADEKADNATNGEGIYYITLQVHSSSLMLKFTEFLSNSY